MGKPQCPQSPDGKHEGEDGVIYIDGKPEIRKVCRWCGKNMGR
jgi:hypothetical protein